jgi:hypothetical protein
LSILIPTVTSLGADDRSSQRCMAIFMSKPFLGPQWSIGDLDIETPLTSLPSFHPIGENRD